MLAVISEIFGVRYATCEAGRQAICTSPSSPFYHFFSYPPAGQIHLSSKPLEPQASQYAPIFISTKTHHLEKSKSELVGYELARLGYICPFIETFHNY